MYDSSHSHTRCGKQIHTHTNAGVVDVVQRPKRIAASTLSISAVCFTIRMHVDNNLYIVYVNVLKFVRVVRRQSFNRSPGEACKCTVRTWCKCQVGLCLGIRYANIHIRWNRNVGTTATTTIALWYSKALYSVDGE